jgi:hypothetical protein
MLRVLIFLALSVLPLKAEQPKIEVPPQITGEACEWIEIPLVTNAVTILWDCTDVNVSFFPQEKLADKRAGIITTKVPGNYIITVFGTGEKGEAFKTRILYVATKPSEKKDSVVPVPDVKPPDKKENPPVVVKPKGPFTIVIVEETAQAAQGRGAFFSDKPLEDAITKGKHKVFNFDKDLATKAPNPADRTKLSYYVTNAKSLPWIYLMTAKGETAFSGAMVKTPAELVQLLSKFGE